MFVATLQTSSQSSDAFLVVIAAMLAGIGLALALPVSMAVIVARTPAERFVRIGTTKATWTRRSVTGVVMPIVGLGYALEWFTTTRRGVRGGA